MSEQHQDPPYVRIAAELRGLIERGELRQGDRVPSTREITQRWGVAMATATKALAALRNDGWVRAVPGVGTVVETGGRGTPLRRTRAPQDNRAPQGNRAPTRQTPEAERIVTAAIDVADTEGLAGLSMRRVATEIGVATMSLYRHVTDKDDLLLKMIDAVFANRPLPEAGPDGWRDRLELAARTLWSTFRRHPWLAPALSMTRPTPVPNAVHYTEWALATLDGHGLDLPTMFTTHITLINYVRGTAVNLEPEAEAEALTGMDNEQWMHTQQPALRALFATGRYPTFERFINERYDFDLDELFEFGLQRLLDGLAPLLGDGPA